ncbi:hypothetical protein [Nguyenibacter sp. L1]|uniref:hypothetical protein n=1 Tax=Nguyenibacter sp. L1 TaxID=3049350 RepID=UPI002B47F7C8|nr:hypothetical protein [Nguyenibacter sp. L1]WRH86677.1 hypothetical protein QN315_11690 [Nguyenibacter sp. L1]
MIIDRIIWRGHIIVGISLGFSGFSYADPHNNNEMYNEFDIDCAKALSMAGDPDRIFFIPVPSGDRFRALREKRIDVGFFNASANINREIIEEVIFVHPNVTVTANVPAGARVLNILTQEVDVLAATLHANGGRER